MLLRCLLGPYCMCVYSMKQKLGIDEIKHSRVPEGQQNNPTKKM